jgi:His-Xaa-Ser system protein HxsD
MMEKKFTIENDVAILEVNEKIYSKETIFAAGYIFLDKAYILLDQVKDKILVYLYPQNKEADLKKLSLEFYNELLNYAHYYSRVKINADAIKTLMQRALFSAAPSLVQETEEKEIETLIKELEEEEKNAPVGKKRKK